MIQLNVAAWEPHNLHDYNRTSFLGLSVLYRSCIARQNGSLESALSISSSAPRVNQSTHHPMNRNSPTSYHACHKHENNWDLKFRSPLTQKKLCPKVPQLPHCRGMAQTYPLYRSMVVPHCRGIAQTYVLYLEHVSTAL